VTLGVVRRFQLRKDAAQLGLVSWELPRGREVTLLTGPGQLVVRY